MKLLVVLLLLVNTAWARNEPSVLLYDNTTNTVLLAEHTNKLELTERFTRSDMNTLQYQVTLTDAGAYTRPWNASWTMQWVAGQEVPTFFCQDNRP